MLDASLGHMVGFPMPSGLKLVLWTLGSMPGVIANGWGTCSMKDHFLRGGCTNDSCGDKIESQIRMRDSGFSSVHAMVRCYKLRRTYFYGLGSVN